MVLTGVSRCYSPREAPLTQNQSFLTPILAGVQATNQNWRWSYYLLSLFTGLLLLVFIFFYEETKYIPTFAGQTSSDTVESEDPYSKEPTAQVVARLGEDAVVANQALSQRINENIPMKSWRQRLSFTTTTPDPIWKLFYRPFIILSTFPAVMFTSLQYGAGLSWLINMSVTIAIIFPYPPYNFTSAQVGYLGLGPFIGNILGSIYSGYLADRSIVWLAKRNKGYYEPEMRLYLLHLPSVALCGGLIMFGVTVARVSSCSANADSTPDDM